MNNMQLSLQGQLAMTEPSSVILSNGGQWRAGSLILSNLPPESLNRFVEFFAATIRNPNTRTAYLKASLDLLDRLEAMSISDLTSIRPIHVATWVEELKHRYSTASVKLKLAGVKMLFDWLVTGGVIAINPAASVKSPRHIVRKGKTPVLDPSEARQLINSIDTSTVIGLRDRALVGTMVYSFARIGAALAMKVEDVYVQNRRLWIRLQEKGGKQHDMPCHHELEEWIQAYIEAANLSADTKGWLFRSIDRNTKAIGSSRLISANAYMMVKRRSKAAGIKTEISNHSFRATGITAYLSNGGTIEKAARMASHASTRTTQLYDRRDDAIVLGEVERVRI
jgi:site-specific recombinase XerD